MVDPFNGLHSPKHNDEVQFYAFDVLAMQGDDLRQLRLHLCKNNLAKIVGAPYRRHFLSDFDQGQIGPDLFRHACLLGLEGLVRNTETAPTVPLASLDRQGQRGFPMSILLAGNISPSVCAGHPRKLRKITSGARKVALELISAISARSPIMPARCHIQW
jgi:hypothetical protein